VSAFVVSCNSRVAGDEGQPPSDEPRVGLEAPDGEAEARLELKSATLARLSALGYTSDDDPLAWREPDFIQRYTAVNFNSLVVTDFALAATGTWQSLVHQESANFTVMWAVPARLDHYALFGFSRDRDVLIELWTLVQGEGTVVIHGANGVAQASPLLVPKEFKRRRVFKGFNAQTMLGMQVDPEERFVLFAVRDAAQVTTVYRLDLADPKALPVPLADSTRFPELSEILQVSKSDHVTLGRVYKFWTSLEESRVVLFVDADNDGSFDGDPLVEDAGARPYEEWTSLNH